MRVRVLTALGLLAVMLALSFFLDTLLLNAVAFMVSALGLLELFKATGLLGRRDLLAVAMTQALVIAFASAEGFRGFVLPLLFLLIAGYFFLLVKHYGDLALGNCAAAFLFATVVPLFFSCAVYIRDRYAPEQAGFYLLIALGAAWLSDTGAYFAGTLFGKRKLAPRVSPKKTVEGTVGGLVVGAGLLLLIGLLYQGVLGENGRQAQVDFLMLALLSPVFCALGMLGDLSASAIKR